MPLSINYPSISQLSMPAIKKHPAHESFCVDRNLQSYFENSHESLQKSVQQLQKDEFWVDIGCGNALATREYVRDYQEGGQAIGISVTRPADRPKINQLIEADQGEERLHLYLGDFLNFPCESLTSKVSLITDIYGAFQYSGQLSRTLEKVYQLLRVGGKAFFSCSFQRPYFTKVTIIKFNGLDKEEKSFDPKIILLWLKAIKGFTFSEDSQLGEEKKFSTFFTLERTSEAFNADPLYINENLTTLDNRRLPRKIFDCFRKRSLHPLQTQNQWTPPVDNTGGIFTPYNYNFTWEISNDNAACLEQLNDVAEYDTF